MLTITKYLDINAGGGNGSGVNTNLEDKLFEGFKPSKTAEAIEAERKVEEEKNKGTTTVTADVLSTETTTLETLLAKDEKTLTVEEKKTLDSLKLKYDIQEVKEDGTPLTKEEKEQIQLLKTKLDGILAKAEKDRTQEEVQFLKDNTEEVKDIYSQVDELSGQPVEVDYGGTDPKSPEGILKREEVIRQQAAAAFDNSIKEEFPIAYQLMLHQKAGGTIDDFFAQGNDEDYNEVTLTKADVKGQERLYRKALTLKGNTAEAIDALVQFAKDKSKLFDFSQSELESLQKQQAVDTETRQKAIKQQEQRETNLVNSFYKATDSFLISGIQGVNIPKVEHKAFTQFIQDTTFVKDGKLLQVVELTNENLERELAANYFKFKKANLSAIAQRKADSINANKIKGLVTKYKLTPKSQPDNNKHFVPMAEI